jgi:hypothetical protein
MSQEKLFTVTGRNIDGRMWFGAFGWCGDYRLAYVMSETDAKEVAIAERAKEFSRPCGNPDNGIYAISAVRWTRPSLYTFADYEAEREEAAQLDSLYGAEGDNDTSHLPLNGWQYRDYAGQGEG